MESICEYWTTLIFSNEIEFHSAIARLLKPGHATAFYMLRDKALVVHGTETNLVLNVVLLHLLSFS